MTITLDPVLFWLALSVLLVLLSLMWILGRGDAYDINRIYGLTWREWVDRWLTLVLCAGAIGATVCLLIVLAAGFATFV